jgi:hypothetical protein
MIGGAMKKILSVAFIGVLIVIAFFLVSGKSYAASLTGVTDVLSRLKQGNTTLSNHTITFTTPTGVAAGGTIIIMFPSDFVPETAIDYTSVDVTDNGSDLTLAASPSGTTWGATFDGTGNRTFTLTSDTGTITAGHTVIIKIGLNATGGSKQIGNPATAGNYIIPITGTFGDTSSIAIAIASEDQVTVTGTVEPYISFNVTDGVISFGTLSLITEKTDTATMTASTNSSLGYSITLNGPTLTNGSYTIDAIGGTATDSTPGTEQFGLRIAASGGSGQSVAPYNDVSKFAFDISNVPDEVAKSTVISATTTYTMTYVANITNSTEAGTYVATHTYVCTGNF